MRIAIISSGFLPITDGVSIALWYRLRYLSQYGHQVILFCPDYSSLAHIYPDWRNYTGEIFPDIKVVNLPSEKFVNLEFERNVTTSSYQIILQELALFQPDIIHVDEPERLWLGFFKRAGLDFAKKANIPCVSFFHTNFLEYLDDYLTVPPYILRFLKLIMRYHRNWIYNGYDLTLVSSTTTTNKLTKLGFKKVLNAELLGVDSSQYQQVKDPNYFAQNYQIAGIEKKIKLLFLGRLTPDKGWKFILNSLSRLTETIDCKNVICLIAGEGNMKEEIAETINKYVPNSYFLGRILPQQVPGLLINSDVYITASEKETRGLTVLEALAAGIPVIAPKAGGIIDSVQDSYHGLLFTPQDTNDFIAKIKMSLENESWRENIKNQRLAILNYYNWENRIRELVAIWTDLL